MKFRILFKDPDGVGDSVMEAVKASLAGIPGLSTSERDALVEAREEATKEAIRTWVEYGEYLEVEFDTESKTARVLTQEERRTP